MIKNTKPITVGFKKFASDIISHTIKVQNQRNNMFDVDEGFLTGLMVPVIKNDKEEKN